jgi:hypothetical protein
MSATDFMAALNAQRLYEEILPHDPGEKSDGETRIVINLSDWTGR